eukprot:CAMPEP_0204587708 /NCGR_PEP_ID=MMETSP0661-20131031/48205_1 /ASSEMBLY_ACC=CAM_ASM_000606 /TAXON_ID=109239 /ORGANISM="Alexandrium margalefi, Strain AMGDE01CS-322" /LENGTH=412 /DNA_ID=CAMNT_0051597453 /DNA_START=3 /DNA_END=1241 /DNA_ORIENTATION=-
MAKELEPPWRLAMARRHRQLQTLSIPEVDFYARWGETADFASSVVNLWFEGKSLQDVLARAKSLGHMEGDMESGYLLDGSFVEELSTSRDLSFEELKPMVQTMSGKESTASVYTVSPHNCFDLGSARAQPISTLRPRDGTGSLNTTFTYENGNRSGVDFIDDLYDRVSGSLEGCDAVELNTRLYMIWKFPHYVTTYHQDTHVPPHITIYNQVSGFSLFHFLPLLVGLYVTHVGRRDASKLEAVLRELDDLGVGSLCTLGPGQVALITPVGSHGVWVPAPSHNPSLPPFAVSAIRAAELFLDPLLREARKRLARRHWNILLREPPEGVAELHSFFSAQAALCREMELSRQDWLSLVRRTWSLWEENARWKEFEDCDSSDEEDEEEDLSDSFDDTVGGKSACDVEAAKRVGSGS